MQDPASAPALERVLAEETAGDPMGRRPKAKRRSLAHLSAVLTRAHHPGSRPTVSRLIRALGYSPKLNARRTEARASLPQRDAQLRHIAGTAAAAGLRVSALLERGGNELGERVSDAAMRQLRLTPHTVCPAWKYTLVPRPTESFRRRRLAYR